ncbi:MAG: 30S ribosomal protein S17 [Chlamydiales bacterium]
MTKENAPIRKNKQGVVVSNKMNKTLVVSVDRTYRHPKYGKIVTRRKKYYAHYDSENASYEIGDKVLIQETRPLSKLKRWIVIPEANTQ